MPRHFQTRMGLCLLQEQPEKPAMHCRLDVHKVLRDLHACPHLLSLSQGVFSCSQLMLSALLSRLCSLGFGKGIADGCIPGRHIPGIHHKDCRSLLHPSFMLAVTSPQICHLSKFDPAGQFQASETCARASSSCAVQLHLPLLQSTLMCRFCQAYLKFARAYILYGTQTSLERCHVNAVTLRYKSCKSGLKRHAAPTTDAAQAQMCSSCKRSKSYLCIQMDHASAEQYTNALSFAASILTSSCMAKDRRQ